MSIATPIPRTTSTATIPSAGSPTDASARTWPGYAWLAATRVAVGFLMLWAFLDKLFGFGFSTQPAKSWLQGGSPTNGFLSHVGVGPFQSLFSSIAGSAIVDTLFMLALLGIGVAMILGAGLRIAAVSNVILMMGMWAAEWPMAKLTSAGAATASTNPFVDYHLVYALIGIVFAYFAVGSRFGLGAWWSHRTIVRDHSSLL